MDAEEALGVLLRRNGRNKCLVSSDHEIDLLSCGQCAPCFGQIPRVFGPAPHRVMTASSTKRNASPRDKILIVGPNGSGRSTLARGLAERLSIPYSAISWFRWDPDSKFSSPDYVHRQLDVVLNGAAWIVDGDSAGRTAEFWHDADLVIWLDYTLPHVLGRVMRRNLSWWLSKTVIWGGNRMSLRSVLVGILDALLSYGSNQQRIWRMFTLRDRSRAMRFTKPADALQWLKLLRQAEDV